MVANGDILVKAKTERDLEFKIKPKTLTTRI